MMYVMKKIFLVGVYLIFAMGARAECTYRTPDVLIKTKPGIVKYVTNMSREEYAKHLNLNLPENNLGLTTNKISASYEVVPFQRREGNKTCVGIRRIVFSIGSDVIYVFIDKKYKAGSCEFNTIKEHEKFHVAVTQQAMSFFKPDLERTIKQAVKKIKPEYVYTGERAQAVLENQARQVMKEIDPIINHINKKIEEKNAIIDTPESYQATTALCKNW